MTPAPPSVRRSVRSPSATTRKRVLVREESNRYPTSAVRASRSSCPARITNESVSRTRALRVRTCTKLNRAHERTTGSSSMSFTSRRNVLPAASETWPIPSTASIRNWRSRISRSRSARRVVRAGEHPVNPRKRDRNRTVVPDGQGSLHGSHHRHPRPARSPGTPAGRANRGSGRQRT